MYYYLGGGLPEAEQRSSTLVPALKRILLSGTSRNDGGMTSTDNHHIIEGVKKAQQH